MISKLKNQRYEKVSKVGEGAYGNIFKALDHIPNVKNLDSEQIALITHLISISNGQNVLSTNSFQQQKNNENVNAVNTSLSQNQKANTKEMPKTNLVALKKYKLNSLNTQAGIFREIKLLGELSHKGIISLIDVFQSNKNIWIAMDYMPYDLYSLIHKKSLNKEKIKIIIGQLLNVIDYLHENNVIHRVK